MDYTSLKILLSNFTSRDTTEIILNFLFTSCKICKKKILFEETKKTYMKEIICLNCIQTKDFIHCSTCKLYYDKCITGICRSCETYCHFFCPICITFSLYYINQN